MNINEVCPVVSVIVPVRNGEKTIEKLIDALLGQDYPAERREIIIVDNDSNDRTVDIVKKYPVMLEKENRVRSSYAARNKGLSLSKGEIIAFTDADCIPERDWLSSGVRALLEKKADMAGGEVSFLLSTPPSAAEIIDSVTFMQNEQNIRNKKVAVTANLFVQKKLFDKIGPFNEVQSGGDILWTKKATDNNFVLVYAPAATVYHPARNFRQLLEKNRRIGIGVFNAEQKRFYLLKFLYVIIRLLIPLPSKNILKFIVHGKYKKKIISIWGISYLCQLNLLARLLSSISKSRDNVYAA